MPSPRSEHAPHFSQKSDKALKKALKEYEALADSCRLTDQQKVEMIIHYVPPFRCKLWKSLGGYASGNWPQYRHSLEKYSYAGTCGLRELLDFVKHSSKTRASREEDVHQYYQEFVALSKTLVDFCWLTKADCDAIFWSGFHPDDRSLFFDLLEVKCPCQPEEIPFDYITVFEVASVVLAGAPGFGQSVGDDEHKHGHAPALEHQPPARESRPPTSDSITVPIHPLVPCPPLERPPGLRCPVAASPPSQRFKDPGGLDPRPHRVDVDLGPLIGTQRRSDSVSMLPPPPSSPDHQFTLPSMTPLPSPPVALSVHSPSPSNLSPIPLPSSLVHLPAHSLSVPSDSSPMRSPSPLVPPPAHSPPPSDSSLTRLPSPPLLVHPTLLPLPPGLSLASPSRPSDSTLMSSPNGSRNFPLSPPVSPARSSLPLSSQSSPTLPTISIFPCSPPPRPPDTTPPDLVRQQLPTSSCTKIIDTVSAPRKEHRPKPTPQQHGEPQTHQHHQREPYHQHVYYCQPLAPLRSHGHPHSCHWHLKWRRRRRRHHIRLLSPPHKSQPPLHSQKPTKGKWLTGDGQFFTPEQV